jgi:chromosome segregation ATPase
MIIFIVLGVVVLLAIGIIGFLFFLLRKESSNPAAPNSEIQKSSVTPYQTQTETTPTILNVPGVANVSSSADSSLEMIRITEEFSQKEEAYQKRVDELETQLRGISDTAQGQSGDALRTVDILRQENEQLKKDKDNYTAMINESLMKAEETIGSMKQDQATLQIRLTDSQEQAQKLQEEIVAIRQQLTQEILHEKTEAAKLIVENQKLQGSLDALGPKALEEFQEQLRLARGQLVEAQSEIERLNSENQMLQAASIPATPVVDNSLKEKLETLEQELAQSKAEAGKITEELEALKKDYSTIKLSNDELKVLNLRLDQERVQLIDKTESFQFELTKARAQTTSFERACENYKNQLKDALQKIESLQNPKSEEVNKTI